ncbi:MAG: hypothetical protein KF795_11320 [Labilithrix sp.]|nr:hypothetical protein [Labilithrix sp.]
MHPTIANDESPASPAASYGRRLLHRWLVEYNPLYLLSATLVLGGMILTSRGLAREGSLYGLIGVAGIAELYALALIGGAALLTRIGQRRPAVMLALLTVLYQCDLTLHTEACTNLGSVGAWAAAGWLALFVAKMYALAWAMKLRLARSAIVVATIGGVGLTLLPHVLHQMDPRYATALVGVWLAALTSLHRAGSVTSLSDLDAWGQTVLRRAVRASWLLSALLLGLHVLFWSTEYALSLPALACVALVLATRWVQSEKGTWCVVFATLLLVGATLPGSFSAVALVAAVTLAVRARDVRRSIGEVLVARPRATVPPYRTFAGDEGPAPVAPEWERISVDTRPASLRLITGAAFAFYLAIWTLRWTGGPWPMHVVPLDVVVTIVVALAAWRLRARLAIAPFAAAWVHFVIQARLIPAPRTSLEWGGASVALGFVLLIASLAASYWLRAPRASSRT